MEYIQSLRAKIGSTKILIPASAVVILNAKDEVLLHLRDDTHSWGLPGGLMDLGETVLENAEREAFEETGLKVRNLRLFGTFSGPRFENRYPGGDETSPVILGFYTDDFEGVPGRAKESLEVGFFPFSALPENMNKFHRWFVESFLEFRRQGSSRPILR
jgi:8-oxo-dGTP pyrophosphatase MutT (NUDIX family)